MAQPPKPKRRSPDEIAASVLGGKPSRPPRTNQLDEYVRQQTGARRSPDEIAQSVLGRLPKPSLPSQIGAGVAGVLAMPQFVASQTVTNLMGIGKSEEEKRKLQARSEEFDAASAALTGMPSLRPRRKSLQQTFEVARGLASIPGEIAKYAAVSSVPGAGLPAAMALGAAEAAGGQAETSLPAMMSRAAGRAGMPRAEQALKRVSESAISRALFDVGAGEAVSRGIQGATAGVRTARQLRGLGDVRVSLDEAAAIGTPRPMQVPLIVPSVADAMGLPGRPIPVSRRLPARTLPEGATLTPSTGVGPEATAPIAMRERTQALLPTPPSPRLLPAGAVPQPESWRNQQLREAIQWAEQQRAQRREARFAEEQQARAMPQQGQVRGLLPAETGRQLRYGAMPDEAPTPTTPTRQLAPEPTRPQAPEASRPVEQVEIPTAPAVERPDVVAFGPQERVPVRYRIVDARSLVPSHSPSTFQPNPNYPKGVQGRNYDTDVAAQRNVESAAQNLDPDPLLDQTITPQSGAPVVTPSGVVVAGNQRSMIIARSIDTAPQRYAAYVQRLRQNAARYGLTADDFAGIERPVLVREMDEAGDEALATLNRLSDVAQTKAKSPLDDAAARFQALRAAPRPLQTLTEKMSDEETLNAFLDRADGQQFVRELVEDGVIAPQEMGRYLADVDRGVLNEEGKAMVQRMVLLAAVEDPVVISRAPASALQKLEGSAPYIVRSAADEGWNVAPLVRDALSVLSEARDKGLRVPDLLSQVSAFDAPIPPAVQRMALFLSETRPTAVKQAFRRYSTAATEARGQAAYGADMFGNVAESAEQAQARLFGQPRTGMAGAVGMGLGQAGAGATTGALTAEEEADRQAVIDRMVLYGLMAGGAGMAGYQAYRRIRGAQPPAPPNPAVVTPAMQQVAGTIFRGNRQLPAAPLQQRLVALPPRIKKGLQDFRTQWVEEARPLIRAGREAAGQTGMRQVQEQIAYSHGSLASAKQYLMDRLGPVLKGLTDDQLQAVGVLLKARRENDIQQIYGVRKADVTQTTLAQAIADGEAQPAVKNAADEVNQLFADLLEMRHDAGLLTDEQYFKIVNSEGAYVAYIKELADDIATGGPMGMLAGSQGGFFARATSGVRAMDRTKENIARTLDPLEAAVMATVKTIQDVKKQQVATTVLDLAETANLPWIRQVKGDPTQPLGKFQFKQIREGKLRLYEVDPQYADFVKAIAGQFTYSQEWYARLLRGWKRLKTAGVTLEPFFQVFNVMRDTIMSGIQRADFQRGMAESAIGAALGGGTGAVFGDEPRDIVTGAAIGAGLGMYARPLTNSLMAFTDIVADRKVYQDFLRNGGSTEGFYVRNADDAHRFIQRMTNGRGVPNVLTPTGWYDVLSFIGSAGEQSTRLAAYKEAREAGLSVGEAVMAAQDRTLRFANRGASSAAKNLASVTPFWNAKMQGWDKLARLLREPKTYAAGTVMITAPSVALWFENKDNPLYWQRPQWERNLFWLVPTPDGQEFVRIPKPFEIGFMFGSSFERVLDYAAQRGLIPSASPTMAEPGAVLARSAMDIATTTGEGTIPVPPIISAPGQLMYDYDIFRNRRIVTRPDLPESMQAQPETSALARQAAQRLGVSPEKVDFALRDVFGTLGAEGSRVLDMAARAAGLPSSEPSGGLPFFGRAELRFITQNRGQTESEVAARERLRRLERVDAGYKEVRKTGDPALLRQYILENRNDLLTLRQLRRPTATQRSLVRQLDDLQSLRRRVQQDKRFTADQRKDILGRIRLKSMQVADRINAMPPGGVAPSPR